MKLWQRFAYSTVILAFSYAASFLVAASAYGRFGGYRLTVGLGAALFLGWIAVLVTGWIVRPAKRTCAVTAVTVALFLDIVAVISIAGSSSNIVSRWFSGSLALMILTLLLIGALTLATYWRTSLLVRLVETTVALGTWALFLSLRLTGRWQFDPFGPDQVFVERARLAGVVLLLATTPVVVSLIVAFWRDRGSALH